MKNLKKVLALVMAFAMAFTMFAGAANFDDVKAGDDYAGAITMLADLEVISGDGKGNYQPTKTITRAEACVLMANIMNGGKADTARFAGGSNFSDVAHGWWGESAIAYCVQNGITYGVGGGKFAPNREITDAEFVAMLTRAMGYDTAANPLSFPYGNYTAAVNNGLLDNVPYVEGSDCTKGEAAQMLYDALFADYARLTANLNVIHNSDEHMGTNTLIENVFGLERAAEYKNDACKAHEWVITGVSCTDDEEIFVTLYADGKTDTYKTDVDTFECTADVSALIGYKVALWGENKHGSENSKGEIDTVKAVEILDGQVAYDFTPAMDLEDDLDLDWDDNKEWKDQLTEKNGNSYVLIDWDDDGEIDYVNATERWYGVIDSVTSKKVIVDIEGVGTKTLDLVDGETKWNCACGEKDHDYEVVLEAEEGDVVEITVADNYDATLTITLTAVDSVAKELTKIDKKGNIYFDGEEMEKSSQGTADYISYDPETMTKAAIDTDYDIWTNANGFIIKWEPTSSSTEYFMLLGVEDGVKKSIDSRSTNAVIEVMYTDGTVEELTVAFDADIPDYDTDTYEFELSSIYQAGAIIGGVFEYDLNDDGEVEDMEMVNGRYNSYDFSDKYDEITYNGNTVEFTGSDFVFVVDDEYVEESAKNGTQSVDTDKVAVLTVDELTDIEDEDAPAKAGAYYTSAIALCGLTKEDQTSSEDYADGALLVVEDLEDYLGTKNHVVGAITDVSVNSKGVYTFEMNDGAEYSTGKTDKDKDLADEKIADAVDSKVIEDLVENIDEMDDYGYAIYADLTIRNDEVVKVVLLTKAVEGAKYMDRKNGDDFTAGFGSDYRVTRGIVKDVTSDTIRVIRGVVAASDKTIAVKDEYKDAKHQEELELTDDTVIWDVDEIPGLVANVKLNGNFSYDKDADITANGELTESKFSDTKGADVLYVVDLIYDDTDKDYPVAAAYVFEDVEDGEYVATVKTEYTVKVRRGQSAEYTDDLVVWVEYETKTDGKVTDSGIVKKIEGLDANDVKVEAQRVGVDEADVNDPTKYLDFNFGGIQYVKPSESTEGYYVVSAPEDFAANDMVKVTITGYGASDWTKLA